MPLTIDPVTPSVGAEASGVDLGKPLDEATLDAIYQALLDHLVLFFRDQDLSAEAHMQFAASFGTLEGKHPIYPHADDVEQITVLENDVDRRPTRRNGTPT
jgi:taurine dioxygenase